MRIAVSLQNHLHYPLCYNNELLGRKLRILSPTTLQNLPGTYIYLNSLAGSNQESLSAGEGICSWESPATVFAVTGPDGEEKSLPLTGERQQGGRIGSVSTCQALWLLTG